MEDVISGRSGARAVLIVESNALLNLFMIDLVEAAGFATIGVSNADEAIPILENRTDIALLVTNVVMPGSMDGVELADIVDNRWPSVKIMVVSGRARLSEQDLPTTTLLFAKPYHENELSFEIRALIGPSIDGGAQMPNWATAIH